MHILVLELHQSVLWCNSKTVDVKQFCSLSVKHLSSFPYSLSLNSQVYRDFVPRDFIRTPVGSSYDPPNIYTGL